MNSERFAAGLEKVASDPTLQRGGADLSDRPKSKGERVAAALDAYERYRSSDNLAKLG